MYRRISLVRTAEDTVSILEVGRIRSTPRQISRQYQTKIETMRVRDTGEVERCVPVLSM